MIGPHLLVAAFAITQFLSAWIARLIETVNDAGETTRVFVEGWLF